MHYYQHHIGDFIKDTANLNDHQLATYMRMIWGYYTDEKPLEDDCDSIAFAYRSDEKTVRLLLRHYFILGEDGWRHGRCDKEIAMYHGKAEKARASANARWRNANALPTQYERNADATFSHANQEPRTNNQEPKESKEQKGMRSPAGERANNVQQTKKPAAKGTATIAKPDDVSQQLWDDFTTHRKLLKATITQTVIDGFRREAGIAGYTLEKALRVSCESGWRGFKAEWVMKDKINNAPAGGRREL